MVQERKRKQNQKEKKKNGKTFILKQDFKKQLI